MWNVRENIAASVRFDRWPSGRSMVAGTALADLSWWLGLKELVAAVPDWAVAGLTLTVSQLPFELVDQGLTWLLFAVSFYVFTPTVYPDRIGFGTDTRLFRAVVVAFSLGFAFVFPVENPFVRIAVLFGFWILGAVTVLVYLRAVEGWTLLGDPAVLLQPFATFRFKEQFQSEFATHLDNPTGLDWFSIGMTLLAVGGLIIFPCVLLGIVALLLLWAGPLPDILVLAWMLWGAFASRIAVIPAADAGRWFDLETRLHHGVQMATKNMKGFFLSIWVVMGIVYPAGTAGVFITALSPIINNPSVLTNVRFLFQEPLIVSTLIGMPSVLLASSLYGFWVWVNAFRRVDAFADYWRATDEAGRSEAERDLQPRPVGMTVPAAVGLVWVILVFHDSQWLFAVSWPLYVLGIGGCVWLTRSRSGATQSIAWEDHIILGSLFVHFLGVYLLSVSDQVLSIRRLGEVGSLLGDSLLVPMVLVAASMTYLPDVARYARKQSGVGEYAFGLYLVGIGSLALVLSTVGTGGPWALFRIFGGAGIGFGILVELVDILNETE